MTNLENNSKKFQHWIDLKNFYEKIGIENKENPDFVKFCSDMALECERRAKSF